MISDVQERPLACWPGKDRLGGEVLDSLTVIFRSGGCSWNACRMCSYRHERTAVADPAGLVALIARQIAWVENEHRIEQYPLIKIYTSGSFFDPGEVPPVARSLVARAFRGRKLIVESRPEYAEREAIGEFIAGIDSGRFTSPVLYVAIGLETADDSIREKSVRKGFSFLEYTTASKEVRAAGAGVKTYLLHKPPFLTEDEAIADMISSMRKIEHHSDLISMNPCTVQRRTELEWYWRQRAYRPPYLWSIIHILRQAGRFITCDPLGGGSARGPHNCGKCDREFVDVIREYSLTGDTDLLDALWEQAPCCREEWEFVRTRESPYCMPLTR
jgi:radical SAM enzyme (TIGR01210 family)